MYALWQFDVLVSNGDTHIFTMKPVDGDMEEAAQTAAQRCVEHFKLGRVLSVMNARVVESRHG